jgi:hypothetical protein
MTLRKPIRHLSFTADRFQEQVAENFRDTDANLRALPAVEFKTIETTDALAGGDPLLVSTTVENPVSVTLARIEAVSDPQATPMGLIMWQPTNEVEGGNPLIRVGIYDVLSIGGLYRVTLRIEGRV